MSDGRNMIAGLYDLGETIGEGHYAVVKLAKHVFTGEKVAVKVIDKMKLDAGTRTQMLQEVRLMKLVQHPNVVRLYEVIDTQTKLYLVLELGDGGDMYDYIMKHEGGLGEDVARRYFRQIVTAISYCHKLHVVHRDLKPENVVFFEKLGMVKLTDFGFSNSFDPGQRLLTSCGSLAYSAPEILLGDAYDAPAVDIWSLGVILYMLVCGSAPFQEANDSETLTMIMDCNYIVPSHVSQPCQALINSMLCRDPSKRATLDMIAGNEWVCSGHHAPLSDMLPLVTREHLTEEEHAHIIQKMASGSIAPRDAIIDCLDRNEYNHITATYFLLAERKLRAQRHDMARKMNKSVKKDRKMDKTQILNVSSLLNSNQASVSSIASMSSSVPTPATQADLSTLSLSSSLTTKRNITRVRKISIVEEEEDEDDDVVSEPKGMPSKGLSRHSSTSSLVDKPATMSSSNDKIPVSPQLHLDLTLAFAAQKLEESGVGGCLEPPVPTPAPFPQSSQIGTGLSRQNSLRRSGESTSGSSPCSERKSTPGSPGSPTTGHTSPARFKLGHSSGGTRKLGGARASPQLSATTLPVLNQIHEESEEGGGSPCEDKDRRSHLGAPAGAAVLRRLEQRRRLHKSRTASCSSSEASDDDSENRKKRGGRAGYPAWRDGADGDDPPGPGGSGGGGLGDGGGQSGSDGAGDGSGGSGGSRSGSSQDSGGSSGCSGGGGISGRHYRLHRSSGGHRVRTSYSLNRINEIHENEISENDDDINDETGNGVSVDTDNIDATDNTNNSDKDAHPNSSRMRRQFTPQLSSESEGEPPPGNDILTRYLLDTLGRNEGGKKGKNRENTEDSLNSSDSEYTTEEDRRRSKVNLRHLEERLNMIQEECNRSDDESDDERSATIDDRSDRNEPMDTFDDNEILDGRSINNNQDLQSDEEDNDDDDLEIDHDSNRLEFESVFNKIDKFLDNTKNNRKNSGRSRSEGWSFSDCEERLKEGKVSGPELGQEHLEHRPRSMVGVRSNNISVRGRPRSAPPRTDKMLHRAHSCSSLISRQIPTAGKISGPGLWNILSSSDNSSPITIVTTKDISSVSSKTTEITLALSNVQNPLNILQIQAGSSRCCNLC